MFKVFLGLLFLGFTALYAFLMPSLWFVPLWLILAYLSTGVIVILLFIGMLPIGLKWDKSRQFTHRFLWNIVGVITFVLRVKVVVEGKENIPSHNHFVVYANHKSYVDPFIIYKIIKRPMAFVSKKGIYKLPIVRGWLEAMGCVPINRDSDREAMESILMGIKRIKEGIPMGIFPEGGIKDRTIDKMVQVKAGAYKLATKPLADILPISMKNTIMIKHRAPFRKTVVFVTIHKPITPETYASLNTQAVGDLVFDTINRVL